MVELGLKSGQAYLRPCSINLSAEIALEAPIRMTLALEASVKTYTPVLSRPTSGSDIEWPRAAHECISVREASFPHKSYLIDCKHFLPKRHSLIIRLTSVLPCFCLSVQDVANIRVFSLLQNWLSSKFLPSVYPRCINSWSIFFSLQRTRVAQERRQDVP